MVRRDGDVGSERGAEMGEVRKWWWRGLVDSNGGCLRFGASACKKQTKNKPKTKAAHVYYNITVI